MNKYMKRTTKITNLDLGNNKRFEGKYYKIDQLSRKNRQKLHSLQKAASTNPVSSARDQLHGDTEKQYFGNIVNTISKIL